jgi:acyl-coenzyme A synthetase/AMP-(fatty) acid ligase
VELFLDRIRSAIARHPQRPAFVGRDGGATYRDLRALLGSAMRGLDQAGVKPGHVVGLSMPQSPVHVIVLVALARLGAITLPLPWTSDEGERTAIARTFGARSVVSGHESGGVPGLPLVVVKAITARGDEGDFDTWPFVPGPDTAFRIALTSGTVGERKGIDHDHAAFSRRLDRGSYGTHAEPRMLPPRLHITAAMQAALHALCNGGSIAFPDAYDAMSLLDAAIRLRVTHLLVPPVHATHLVALVAGDRPVLPSLAQLRLVGSSASPALVAAVRRKLSPNIRLGYSTTETGVIASATPELLDAHPGCAGRLAPDATLQVLDEHGVVLPPGATGEFRVRVEGMPGAYHGGAHGDRFRDGWFYPHDRGQLSADGIVFIEGRTDFVINVGGRKVSPEHVERCLEGHPGVAEVAVFAMEGEAGVTRTAAAVVRRGSLDWEALSRHAQSRLDVLAPSRYYEARSLPRNASGKLKRSEFAALAAGPLRHPA